MQLLNRAKNALLWNAAFNVFRDLLSFVVMLILVRILEPDQYGKFALVTSIIGFISVFSQQNFIAHTLQIRDDADVDYQQHFTAGGVVQISLFFFTNCLGFVLGHTDTYAEVAPLIYVMSITFLLEWPCELKLKMLERKLAWRRLRLLHALGLVISSVMAIAMGLSGAGVYALLIPGLVASLPLIVDLLVFDRWRPTWSWNAQLYMPAFRFGLTRLTSGLAARARRIIESGAVVYLLGFTSAGLFERAIALGLMFSQRVTTQIMYTLYPVLTKLEPGTEQYRKATDVVIRGVAWFVVPVTILLVTLTEPLIHLIYGHKWNAVVPLAPYAILLGGVGALAYVVYMLLLGHNGARRCVYTDLFELLGTIVSLGLLVGRGLRAYILGLVLVRLVAFGLGTYWLVSSNALEREKFLKGLIPPILASGFAYFVCEMALILARRSIEDIAVVFGYSVLYFVTYILFMRFAFSKPLVELVRYLPGDRVIGRILFLRHRFALDDRSANYSRSGVIEG